MAVKFSRTQKDCATCEYWDGVRKISADRAWADCPSDITMGICKNATSSFKGKLVKANYSSCTKFVKWEKLK